MKRLQLLAPCALLALTACNEDPGADNGKGDHIPSPLPSTTGSTPAYPPGPYDVTQGSVLADYTFQGFVDAKAESTKLQDIHLHDFYNPHAHDPAYTPLAPAADDRLFPSGSPYGAGKQKPRALVIDIASVWCGPCNEEAKVLLPPLHAKYRPCGGEFFFQLIEGPATGTPATAQHLLGWTTRYKVDYPAMFDPGRKLSGLYSSNSYPDSAIVDTSTMKIVAAISGVPDDGFWKTFESLLDASCLAGA